MYQGTGNEGNHSANISATGDFSQLRVFVTAYKDAFLSYLLSQSLLCLNEPINQSSMRQFLEKSALNCIWIRIHYEAFNVVRFGKLEMQCNNKHQQQHFHPD